MNTRNPFKWRHDEAQMGLWWSRYIGEPRTHLQHVVTATALQASILPSQKYNTARVNGTGFQSSVDRTYQLRSPESDAGQDRGSDG